MVSNTGSHNAPEPKHPLRIFQVSTRDLGGGAEGSAFNLFRAYRDLGHHSWLAVGRALGSDPAVFEIPNDSYRRSLARLMLRAGRPLWSLEGKVRGIYRLRHMVRMISEPSRWFQIQRGLEDFDYPGTRHLCDLIPEPPDIVHCHNLHGGYFDLRVLPWLSHQVPVILNLRDAWLLTGHCSCFSDCDRWKTGCGQCPHLDTYPAVKRDATGHNWRRKRDIYRRSHLYITTPSNWLMDKVKASALKGARYRVIPNGIDLTVFRPGSSAEARSELGLPSSAKIVLLTAHNPFKDYDTMKAALRRLQNPDSNELLFVCLGRTEEDKGLGAGRMIYSGLVRSPERMARYFRASDVFIHAATDEMFGKTIAEARACGIPVVATAVGGIPEQIEHRKTGFLVPAGDSVAMSSAVECLLADPELAYSVGQAGLADTRERHGLARQARSFLDWYREIIDDWKTVHDVSRGG